MDWAYEVNHYKYYYDSYYHRIALKQLIQSIYHQYDISFMIEMLFDYVYGYTTPTLQNRHNIYDAQKVLDIPYRAYLPELNRLSYNSVYVPCYYRNCIPTEYYELARHPCINYPHCQHVRSPDIIYRDRLDPFLGQRLQYDSLHEIIELPRHTTRYNLY